jgi:hypothetical protein
LTVRVKWLFASTNAGSVAEKAQSRPPPQGVKHA